MTSKSLLLAACLAAAAMAASPAALQGPDKIPCISRSRADSLSTRLVQWNGRVCPLNTLATDVTLRLTGSRRPFGYTPEQVVASWALYPEVWNRAPLLRIDHAGLRRELHLTGKYAAVSQLYDGGTYRLQTLWDAQADKHSSLCHAITEADSRVRLVGDLVAGRLIQPAPEDATPPSALRLHAEMLCNKAPVFDILYGALLLLGTAVFIRRTSSSSKGHQP